MANKTLTARVKFDTSGAEQALNRLSNKIKALNAATKIASNDAKVERSLAQQAIYAERVSQARANTQTATVRTQIAEEKLTTQLLRSQEIRERMVARQNSLTKHTKSWIDNIKKGNTHLQQTDSIFSGLMGKLKWLASTYLGIMGIRGMTETSDTITGAQNKLNYVNANQLGESGHANGGYSNATLQMTQESLDKMYSSAQKVRMAYGDMISNVSKSMMLAGEAFQNNTDYAIRFQEVMAEAYAIGGASQAEMSSSMYQLIQSLGAGTLAGDELRSVREGAPLAYKAIEEFVQGVYNSEESLKELGSQGKVTSDMVVAAILNAGSEMDQAFAMTKQRFDQTWAQIKNSAMKAFEPVSNRLREMLNEAIDNGMISKIETAFIRLARVVDQVFTLLDNGAQWISDNWYWLQIVVCGVLIAIGAQAMITGFQAFTAFLLALSPLTLWIILITLVVAGLVWLLGTTSSVCNMIAEIAYGLFIAIMTILTMVLVAYLATGAVMLSVPVIIALLILAVLALIAAMFFKYTGAFIGAVYGFCAVVETVCNNIRLAWSGMTSALKGLFLDAVADMLDSCGWLLNGINKIREALNMDPISIEGLRQGADEANAQSKASYGAMTPVGDAWNSAYDRGKAVGDKLHDKIDKWGNDMSEKFKSFNLGDELGEILGTGGSSGYTPYDTSNLGSGFTPDLSKGVGNIDNNTGKIADSLDLTEEDLKYLRQVAEMEWKKEFTTANITVDMSNYNTINGNDDLDGIVTRLTDKLYEELDAVANGVYV